MWRGNSSACKTPETLSPDLREGGGSTGPRVNQKTETSTNEARSETKLHRNKKANHITQKRGV